MAIAMAIVMDMRAPIIQKILLADSGLSAGVLFHLGRED